MRKPNHLVLDFESSNSLNSNFYWASKVLTNQNTPLFLNYVNTSRRYNTSENSTSPKGFVNNIKTNIIKPNNQHKAMLLREWEKQGLLNIYQSTNQVTSYQLKYKIPEHDMFNYLNLNLRVYKKQKIAALVIKYLFKEQLNNQTILNTSLSTLNVNFLRKERLYTKLKYSRSPAYDIVSGGAAALLAGFIGFLISEKFGYELVDSGDFYYAFMYIVFLVFSLRPILTVSDSQKGFLHAISLRSTLLFYSNLVKLLLKKLS